MSGDERVANINIAILGHVDSGKTSLARALSQICSTASLDKSPQSQERGITLDIGFSSFNLSEVPPMFAEKGYNRVQYTLVDCPGHASLLRTVIGGSLITTAYILVVDACKGFQTQTSECLVVAEIASPEPMGMVVALNKCDMLPGAPGSDEHANEIRKVTTRITRLMSMTRFKGAPVVPLSACPGASLAQQPQGVDDLIQALVSITKLPPPPDPPETPFLAAVDHCFQLRGQGTVMTTTILQGNVEINSTIDIPSLKLQRRVKSLQVFRRPVAAAHRGDRVGILVTQLDAAQLERGLICTPGFLSPTVLLAATVHRVRFFRGPVRSRSKFHVTVGHTTVMATILLFKTPEPVPALAALVGGNASAAIGAPASSSSAPGGTTAAASAEIQYFSTWCQNDAPYAAAFERPGATHLFVDELPDDSAATSAGEAHYVLLHLEQPVFCAPGSTIIASHLDSTTVPPSSASAPAASSSSSGGGAAGGSGGSGGGSGCRLAFFGRFLRAFGVAGAGIAGTQPPPAAAAAAAAAMPTGEAKKTREDTPGGSATDYLDAVAQLRIFKRKEKRGQVDRVADATTGAVIVKGMFPKEGTDLTLFTGLRVETPDGTVGQIEGPFGRTGKIKAIFAPTAAHPTPPVGTPIILRYKKFLVLAGSGGRRRIQQ